MINQEISSYHKPVLLQETLEGLKVEPGKWYVDATLGGGGHTKEILRLGGNVLGIDQDQDAIAEVMKTLRPKYTVDRLKIVQANFVNLKQIVSKLQIEPQGILFDLGVSSYQLSGNGRGFSFQYNEPLDMRMDTTLTVTAKDLVNGLYEQELEKLISSYGEDKLARPIARAIVSSRKQQAIETTWDLKTIIENIYKKTYRSRSKIHPATRTFQALRMAVNDELHVLESALEQSFEILGKNGRCVVISFQGLEDKVVKAIGKKWEEKGVVVNLTKHVIRPSEAEITANPRSRSAKMRIFEKTNYA